MWPAVFEWFGSFRTDHKGVVAVEMALLPPFLIVLFCGITELSFYISAHHRASQTSAAMADAVSRYDTITAEDLTGIMSASAGILDAAKRNDWVPTYEEMARFIDATRAEHIFRFCILALNTWARRETIEQLDLSKQVNLRTGLIDLNERGRLQTHKRRPIIRLTDNLRAWMPVWAAADKALADKLREQGRPVEWKAGRPLLYGGRDAGAIKKSMQRTNARWMLGEAGVAEPEILRLTRRENSRELTEAIHELEANGAHRITSRAIRSFMATRVRAVPCIKVDREQRQLWLGHLNQDTTSSYEIADPEYMREAAAATDAIIRKIDEHCGRSLWPKLASQLPRNSQKSASEESFAAAGSESLAVQGSNGGRDRD